MADWYLYERKNRQTRLPIYGYNGQILIDLAINHRISLMENDNQTEIDRLDRKIISIYSGLTSIEIEKYKNHFDLIV